MAVFRILLGAVLLVDLFLRLPHFEAHYGVDGIFPWEALMEMGPNPRYFSLFFLWESDLWGQILFGMAGVSAICLMVGWHTRWMSIACWMLWISIQNRNPLLIDGGDNMILAFLFWGIFLPWGARYSLEADPDKPLALENRLILPEVAVILQFILIYTFTALWKFGPEWHSEGTALYMALKMDTYTRAFAGWLVEFPQGFLQFLTRAVWWFELLGPFLVIIPWKNARFRMVAVIAFIAFQVMLALTFSLGLFPLISIVVMVVFLPGSFWDWLNRGKEFVQEKPDATTINKKTARLRWLGETAMAILLLYVIAINVFAYQPLKLPQSTFQYPAEIIRMDQRWGMFGPSPDPEDGWFIVNASLENGQKMNILPWIISEGEPIPENLQKPISVRKTYGSARWQSYLVNIWLSIHKEQRPWFLQYVCRKWRKNPPIDTNIQSLTLIYMLEKTGNWKEFEPKEIVLVPHFRCEAGTND